MAYLPTTYITGMSNTLGSYVSQHLSARNWLYSAGDAIAANQWANAKTYLYYAADGFGTEMNPFMYTGSNNFRYWLQQMFNWIHNNLNSTPTVSLAMGDILTAMLQATFDELTGFVGIEDAYRSALWNKPFNAEYYAALARGFMQ